MSNKKLSAQENDIENSNIEMSEVKDYKPRKQPIDDEREIKKECNPEVRSWIRMYESLSSSKGFIIWMMETSFKKL